MSHSFGRPPATEQPETSRGEASVTQRELQIFLEGHLDSVVASLSAQLSSLTEQYAQDVRKTIQDHQSRLVENNFHSLAALHFQPDGSLKELMEVSERRLRYPSQDSRPSGPGCLQKSFDLQGQSKPDAQGDDIVPPLPAVLEEKDRDEPEGLRFSHESSHEKVERIQEAAPVTPGKVKLRLSMESSISNMSQDQGTITPMSPMESDAGGVEVARQPTESKSPFARRLAAGRKSVRQHESGELTPKVSKDSRIGDDRFKKVIGVIESSYSDFVMGILILLNALVMTLELECIGNRSGLAVDQPMTWDCGDTQLFPISEHIFTWIFAGELALRVYAQRCAYFKDLMNIADTVLVILPMLDLYVFKPLAGFSPNIDILRLLRLGKLVRAVRLMRTLRLFQGLRLLVQACSSFLPSLMWSMALLGVCMMMGSLVMGNLLQEFIKDPNEDEEWRLWVWTYYGTAYRAMYTMYELTFAGNWPTRARPVLENVDHSYALFYVVYVTFIVFAVIRVITAVFLRETLEAANNDAELIVQERLRQKAKYVKKLEGIFVAMDESGDGMLTEEEMTELLMDHRVQAYLSSMDLDLSEGEALFRLLQNGEGMVTYEDFIDGVMRCKGPAKAIDQICLQCDLNNLTDSVKYLTAALEQNRIIQKRHERKRRKRPHLTEDFVLMGAGVRHSRVSSPFDRV